MIRESFHVTCTGGHARASVYLSNARENAALADALSKAIVDGKRNFFGREAVVATIQGGYATAVVYDSTEAQTETLAELLNAAIRSASTNWKPSWP